MLKMREVAFKENFEIQILLTDGRICRFDMKPKLKTVRFFDLQDWEIFSKGQMKHGQMICWDNGAELSVDEVMYQLNE